MLNFVEIILRERNLFTGEGTNLLPIYFSYISSTKKRKKKLKPNCQPAKGGTSSEAHIQGAKKKSFMTC
jgi:hypothetical protein